MAKIIGISGFIGCGKSTVAMQLMDKYEFRKDSFAVSLKDACAALFDWPRDMLEGDTKESREWREITDEWWANKLDIPNFSPRLALQLIGTDSLRNHFNPGLWFMTLENRVRKDPIRNVVISDVRFPNEVEFIHNQGGILIRVDRGPSPVWFETALMANRGNSIAKDIMTNTYSSAHQSEWAWVGQKYNFVISNNGTLEDMQLQVDNIISKIL